MSAKDCYILSTLHHLCMRSRIKVSCFYRVIADLLLAEGPQLELHTSEKLVTHRSQNFCLSHVRRSFHRAAAPVVQTVKTELPYQNNTIIALFFPAKKIKTTLKVLWPLLIVNLRIWGLSTLFSRVAFITHRLLWITIFVGSFEALLNNISMFSSISMEVHR